MVTEDDVMWMLLNSTNGVFFVELYTPAKTLEILEELEKQGKVEHFPPKGYKSEYYRVIFPPTDPDGEDGAT